MGIALRSVMLIGVDSEKFSARKREKKGYALSMTSRWVRVQHSRVGTDPISSDRVAQTRSVLIS